MPLAYLTDPNGQFFLRNGSPNVGGFIRVYYNGTDDAAVTYSNFEGALNPEQIPLDLNGRAVIIAQSAIAYRVEVYDRKGALQWTVTNLMTQFFGIDVEGEYPVQVEDNGAIPGRSFAVNIAPNGIGRDLLKNHHNLVPDKNYLEFKDFAGDVVVTLCETLRTWLKTEHYTP